MRLKSSLIGDSATYTPNLRLDWFIHLRKNLIEIEWVWVADCRNVFEATSQLWAKEGIRGFYCGYSSMVIDYAWIP
jgi:hypothetical protein